MKKTFIAIAFVCSTAVGSNLCAQQTPPPGAGDRDLRDTGVKSRSVEMERIKREANKTDKSAAKNPVPVVSVTTAEDSLAAKYEEIKTDYEQIQKSQDVVVKTYQGTGKIDYAQIARSATEINESATRLNSNLFPAPAIADANAIKEEKKQETAEKTEKEIKPAKSVRDLIVDLDNAVGSFATSPMFQNLRTVDPKISEKARLDLDRIIELSEILAAETAKMTKTN